MSQHEEPPVDISAVPDDQDVNEADASEDLDQAPDEQANYTDRHPEHFRNPPGHVSEFREEQPETGDSDTGD